MIWFLLALVPLAQAVNITGSILPNNLLESHRDLPPSTQISLNYGDRTTYIRQDGSFLFEDIPPGFHTLNVLSKTHAFPDLSISIPKDTDSPFIAPHDPSRVLPFSPSSPPSIGSLPYPIEWSPSAKADFTKKKESFDVKSLLGNPMILMTVGSGLLMFMMPKLLANMDPETMEEAQKLMGGSSVKQERLAPVGPPPPSLSSSSTTTGPVAKGKAGGNGGRKKR